MPHELDLPKRLKARGWKVKIREKERLEPPHLTILCGKKEWRGGGGGKVKIRKRERWKPPHLTILCGKKEWRVGLRDGSFLAPPGGKWADIDAEVRRIIEDNWQDLQDAWDKKYPSNPIASKDDDE